MIGKRIFSGLPNEDKIGYARAAVVEDWVFVSGTTGFDPTRSNIPPTSRPNARIAFAISSGL
jgi:enamine deaminase RidA (YjgF/YER057c/UK114 family)